MVDQYLLFKSGTEAEKKLVAEENTNAKEELKGKDTKMVKAAKNVIKMANFAKAIKGNAETKKGVQQYDKKDYERNPKLYLPSILFEYRADVNTIDLVGRMLWHFTDKPEFIATATLYYEKAERAFPDRKATKLLRVSFLTSASNDPSAHLSKLEAISKLEPSMATRYFIFRRRIEVKKIAAKVTSEDQNSAEIVDYVEFQKYFADTQQITNVAIQVFFLTYGSLSESFGCFFCKNLFLFLHSLKPQKKWKLNVLKLLWFTNPC